MRHYLFLSVEHAIRKYVERGYAADEVEAGWHRQARRAPCRGHLPSLGDRAPDLRLRRRARPFGALDGASALLARAAEVR